jgi:hypothetical protein
MYNTTHYTTAATQQRANIVQAAVYAALNKKLQKYNAKHNTNFKLVTQTYKSTCNTQYVVSFTITQKSYKRAVKLFNKTVQAFYKFKCCSMQHYCNISSNSYVACAKTNAQVY